MGTENNNRGGKWIGKLIRDTRFASRMLWKNLCFTLLAILTLGLGIGAVSMMFGAYNVLVLDPVPYPESQRMVYIWSMYDGAYRRQPLSAPDFKDIRDQSKSYEAIGVYTTDRLNLGLESPMPAYALRCTAGVLRSFVMNPMLGRLLDDADEKPGADPVAVISHSLWVRALASDPKAIGRSVRIDGKETLVVGVMPPNFEMPSPWYSGHDYDVWVPLCLDTKDGPQKNPELNRSSHWLVGVARLKEGVTIEAADAEIKTIGARLKQTYPNTNQFKPFAVCSFLRMTAERTSSGAPLLFGAAAILFLVACANVASLLMAQGAGRQGEFSLRLAVGGSRGDILRLLLLESLLLGFLGGIVGILTAKWGLDVMKHVMPSMLAITARREALQLGGPVLLFSMGTAVVSTAVFGLLPAFTASRTAVAESLKSEGRFRTGTRLRHRFLRYLVAGQIALALALGSSAILLSTSYLKIFNDNRDLNSDQILTTEIALRGDRYIESEGRKIFWRDLFERIRGLPGVEHVAITTKLPLEGGNNLNILVDDEVYDPEIKRPLAEDSSVSPDYFDAMGITLLRGHIPESEDTGQDVVGVVVNRALAEKCWPGKDPLGGRIRPNTAEPWFQAIVVGVVSDVRQWNAEEEAIPEIYFPRQDRFDGYQGRAKLVIRTSGNAHKLIPSLAHILKAIDPDMPMANIRSMKEVLSNSMSMRRFATQLMGMFMVLTVILAMVGVYGTLSYSVSQRGREIGVRMALGAKRRDIFKFVFRQASPMVGGGLAAGLILTVVLSFIMRAALYRVNPLDPILLLIGLIAICLISVMACFFPARRATKVNPMETLRCE